MSSDESLPPLELPKEPIRVALVITGLEVGGAEKCLAQLAIAAKRREPFHFLPGHAALIPGFEPVVYSLLPRPEGSKAKLVEELEAAGIPVHFVNVRSAWNFPRALLQLRRLLRKQQAQVVQTFLYHGNVVGVLAARLAGIRDVFTGLRVADPRWFRGVVERWVYALASLNISVSDGVVCFYQKQGFKRPGDEAFWSTLVKNPLVTIPNGINVARYREATPVDLSVPQIGIGPERRVMLFVGRLHEQKGLDWFLICLPGLLQKLPDYEFVLVGDGPQRDALMRQAVQLDVADHVHFLGWRPDVPEFLKRADLLVLTSRYEGMPNVLLEAMATGLPTVTTRVEGVKDILGERYEELTADFGDSQAFINRIVAIASDEAKKQEIGQWAYDRVKAQFSLRAMTHYYQTFWVSSIVGRAFLKACRESPSPRRGTPAPEADSI
jgi:glycosyltransferase involved in cell wall biosynthesis